MKQYLTATFKIYIENYSGIPKSCWQSIALTFLECTAIGTCYFLSLFFVGSLNLNIATSGILLSCYGIGTVIGGLIAGKLSDKISPRIISTISLLVQAISFLLLAKLNSVNLMIVNLFILGLTTYGFKTSNDVWMLSQCNSNNSLRLKTLNISRAAQNLGLGVSGIIIGLFAGYSFYNIFYFFSFLLFLSSVYLITLQTEKTNLNLNSKIPSPHETKNLKKNSDSKILILILFCLFLIGLMIAQLSATYPIYIKDSFPELGIKAVSILYILDTFLIVIFQAPLVNFLNNFNKLFISGIGAFLMGFGIFILSFSSPFYIAILSCVIWTTGEMLFMPMAQLVCYEKGGEKKKGQSMGIFQATYASSSVMGPTLGGFLYYYLGGNNLWIICGIIGFSCLILCSYYKKHY